MFLLKRFYLRIPIVLLFLLSFVFAKKSFTIVLDTTYSMKEELKSIKVELRKVLQSINENNFDNFILVQFTDPEVTEPRISSNKEGLISNIESITTENGQGQECPENSVTALEKALELSHPESVIFLFTDAYADDAKKLNDIKNLCSHTRSQINIILSGFCVPTDSYDEGDVQVFYDIAKACAGTLFRMDPITSEVFTFMKEIVKVDEWAEIATYGYEPSIKTKEFTFSVDQLRNEVIIVANGKHPSIDIWDKYDNSVAVEKIVDHKDSLVVRLITEYAAEYKAIARSRASVSVTLYRRSDLPFAYGFSTKTPRSFRETSLRPLPDVSNYIIIQLKSTSVKLNAIELHMGESHEVIVLKVGVIDNEKRVYIAETFIEKDKSFKMFISLENVSDGKTFNVSTRILKPQQKDGVQVPRGRPVLDIITYDDTKKVKFGDTITIPCKVTGFPKPEIKWEDSESWSITTEEIVLEIPNVYINYATISNIDQNRTLVCKARNSEGEASSKVELTVFRPFTFEIVQAPEDSTFDYGSQGRLECKVNAYPEAKITWYHNDTLLKADSVFESNFVIDDESLTIKNVTLDDAGTYTCKVENDIKTDEFPVQVTISAIEAPEVEIDEELLLRPGDWRNIECKVSKGKPKPSIKWMYKGKGREYLYYDGPEIPDGIVIKGAELKISSAKMEHNGIYSCRADNIFGTDTKNMIIKVQYPPEIANKDQDSIEVIEEETVSIDCIVDSVPEANINWEFYQEDRSVPLDHRKTIDANHTLRFVALWNDSGTYHCVAENSLGKTEKIVEVNVLVRPYIEPQPDVINLKSGESVTLHCNIMYGNPPLKIKWEFRAPNSTSAVLTSNNSKNTYHLDDVGKGNEGTYVCVVENTVGYDSIQIYIKVD